MAEIGIDIYRHCSKPVDEFVHEELEYILTVGDHAQENCPCFPAKTKVIHHSFEDPAAIGDADKETTIGIFRRVRDEINKYLIKAIENKVFG